MTVRALARASFCRLDLRTGAAISAIAMIATGMGCGESTSRAGADDEEQQADGGGASKDGSAPVGSFGNDASAPPPPSTDGCSDAAKLVYVVSRENDLYSFTPNTTTFAIIGRLDCPAKVGATPNSMAVDRKGTAWINYADGTLFQASTTDAKCTATTFKPNQAGFGRFGMAFATNSAGSSDETLYVWGIDALGGGKGLAKIDTTTMTLTKIGDASGSLAGVGAELTGTGDGRLFGFFTTKPNAKLAQINPASGATSNETTLTGVNTGTAWAFSFWGGDFWFYTANGGTPSKVTRLKTSENGEIGTAKADVGGFGIVGAGVSTCAPVTPPGVN